MYKVNFSENSELGLIKLMKSEKKAYNKAKQLIDELLYHPTSGTGKPEQLKGYDIPTWSRRITSKHRLIYEIHDDIVVVIVLSTYGHYKDK